MKHNVIWYQTKLCQFTHANHDVTLHLAIRLPIGVLLPEFLVHLLNNHVCKSSTIRVQYSNHSCIVWQQIPSVFRRTHEMAHKPLVRHTFEVKAKFDCHIIHHRSVCQCWQTLQNILKRLRPIVRGRLHLSLFVQRFFLLLLFIRLRRLIQQSRRYALTEIKYVLIELPRFFIFPRTFSRCILLLDLGCHLRQR